MRKKLTYRNTRNVILPAMIAGLVMMFVSAFALKDGSLAQEIVAAAGVVIFFAALAFVLVAFRCPACGAHFFKSALFIAKCPVCGFEFADFEIGKKVEHPGWTDADRKVDTQEKIKGHD